ncbi:MAG: hypothetical protein ACYC63_08570 [Armatimonadota bacterium]
MWRILVLVALLTATCACCQQATIVVDDFRQPTPLKWSTSMSPQYYQGDNTKKGLQIVNDPERGPVLAADVRFVSPLGSEPCFINRDLDQPVPLVRLSAISFWYKIVGDAALDPVDGFKVRLRTSPTAFRDYAVPSPQIGKWTHVVIPTRQSNVVNVWGSIFGAVKQLTFRLDDQDTVNSSFTLLVSQIELTSDEPLAQTYAPRTYPLAKHEGLNVVQIKHAAAGHYQIAPAAATLPGKATTRTFPFKGLHFDLTMYGYPTTIQPLLSTDLIVMIDTDPFVMSGGQARDLADLVYSGAGMIFFAGANTLGNSKDFKRPLMDLMPVTFTPDEPGYVSRVAKATGETFDGLTVPEGEVGIASSVQKLVARPGARVLVQGDDRPLVVISEFGKGRVAFINAQPNLDQTKDFFTMSPYPALLQRLMFWATHREAQYDPAKTSAPVRDEERIKWVNNKARDFRPFPIITMAGMGASGHYLDEVDIAADLSRMQDYGFNTIAVGGLTNIARNRDKPTAADRNALTIQRLASGMGLIYEYTGFNLINSQGPTKPCVFSPEYQKALAEKLGPQLEVAKNTPNLLSVKILDEPTASAKNLDYCEYCQREFQKRYGIPLRKFEEIPADATYERWAFANFIGDYVAEGYRQGHEFKEKSGAMFDLLLTYMSSGLGYERPLSAQQASLKWTKQADRFDFDVYPYFYPASQKIRMVQAAWCMAYSRALSHHLRKPWGFYIELDDRNWPFQKNPKEATAECAYEAVLHGANYLNSFIHVTFGTGNDARPERWTWTAQELPKIASLAPKLAKLQRPMAPVALLYPISQTYITNEPVPKPYSYACVSSGFGNVDVLPEDVALEQGDLQYKALILLGCEILHADMAGKLRQWLDGGGRLIVDKLPSKDHRGEALPAWPEGKVVLLDCDFEQAYKTAIEGDQTAEAKRLREQLAKLIGVPANAVVSDAPAQMEIGIRTSKDAALVIVLNHDAKENTGQVMLRDLGFTPKAAREAVTGKAYPVQIKAGACTFTVKLPARQAVMVELR